MWSALAPGNKNIWRKKILPLMMLINKSSESNLRNQIPIT